jgi:hypothetical protein
VLSGARKPDAIGLPVKIAALFGALEAKDLDDLSPVERRRFGELLRHWAELVERGRRPQGQPCLETCRPATGACVPKPAYAVESR